MTWSNTEREAVRQSIAQFHYVNGSAAEPEPLLGRLEQIAARYHASGHRVAVEFDHVQKRVKSGLSTAPEKQVWFLAVLEARLKRATRGATPMQAEWAPGREIKPVAQSSAPEPTCGTGRELYDTQALIRGVAKSMEERQTPATMEEIYQQLNDKRAS